MQHKVRRHDLDWVRVLVFALLIFYHVGMFFVHWDWHIKNNIISESIWIPMSFVNRWRLALLFVISGMGTFFALGHRSQKEFTSERLKRLGIPFLFGTLLLIAPQIYVERIIKGQFEGSYFDFYPIHFFQGIYPTGNFSWHHLWFLPYLLTYSLILTPVFVYWREHPNNKFLLRIQKLIESKWGLLLFLLPLYITEALIEPFFPSTHAFLGDWYAQSKYCLYFLYGFLFMTLRDSFWQVLSQIKYYSLAIGIVMYAILYFVIWQIDDTPLVHFTQALVDVANTMAWILTILAFAAEYLNRPSKVLSYCNRAVYPFYILHQTLIIIFAYFIYDQDWSISAKFLFLSFTTFGTCWLLYELIRRIKVGRILFGIKG